MKVVIFGGSTGTSRRSKASRAHSPTSMPALYCLGVTAVGMTETSITYPILRRLFPKYVTTTVNIGRAMIHVAAAGYSKQVLSSADINQLSG
jgi:hypothetical protein